MGDTTKESPFAGSDFKQQRQQTWRPKLTPICMIATFLTLGVLMLAVGISLKMTFDSIDSTPLLRYDNVPSCSTALRNSSCYADSRDANGHLALQGSAGKPLDPLCARRGGANGRSSGEGNKCEVKLTVPRTMRAPVYVYYYVGNFYQNHREYAAYAKSDAQLRGKTYSSEDEYTAELTAKCGNFSKYCTDGLLPSDVPGRFWCNPCGSAARSFFTDTFELLGSSGAIVPWSQNHGEASVAWSSDVEHKFKNSSASEPYNKRNADENALVLDPDFMVWVRPSGLSKMRKLYRIINQDVPAGDYTLRVFNNYDVEYFAGSKSIELTSMSWLGAQNHALAGAYLVAGALCVLVAGGLVVAEHRLKQKAL